VKRIWFFSVYGTYSFCPLQTRILLIYKILLDIADTLCWFVHGHKYGVFWKAFGFTLLFGTTMEFVMAAL